MSLYVTLKNTLNLYILYIRDPVWLAGQEVPPLGKSLFPQFAATASTSPSKLQKLGCEIKGHLARKRGIGLKNRMSINNMAIFSQILYHESKGRKKCSIKDTRFFSAIGWRIT